MILLTKTSFLALFFYELSGCTIGGWYCQIIKFDTGVSVSEAEVHEGGCSLAASRLIVATLDELLGQ